MDRPDGLKGDELKAAQAQAKIVFADGKEVPFIDLFSYVQVAASVAANMTTKDTPLGISTYWMLLPAEAVRRMPGVIETLRGVVEQVMKRPDEDHGLIFFPLMGTKDDACRAGYAAVDALIKQTKEVS